MTEYSLYHKKRNGFRARYGTEMWIIGLTALVLGVAKIVYFKAGSMWKDGKAIDWVQVFGWSDFSFSLVSTFLVAIVYFFLSVGLRKWMPEKQVALRYLVLFGLTAFLGGIVSAANMAFYYRLYGFPLPEAVWMVDSAVQAFVTALMLIAVLEVFHYRGAWMKEQYEREQNMREMVSAKFEALKNQLSPHFVFNSFNTLGAMIGEDQERAQLFLNQLSQVYRYILDNKDRETVSLGREIDSVQALLHIQQARHPGAVDIHIDVAEADRDLRIIPLTLHTLVENVFKHNVLSEKAPISLRITVEGARLLVVENDLKPKLDVESHHIGIANLSKRYELLVARGLEVIKGAESFRVEVPFVPVEAA
ncbi:MAG: histidine kinase [Alphaproteobacteria bacterium]|nr:histidine kinase [Alphaproteobacteria bacterium]